MLWKIGKLGKFWAWEKVKNKKFFEAEIGIFLRSSEPQPKKSHSYKKECTAVHCTQPYYYVQYYTAIYYTYYKCTIIYSYIYYYTILYITVWNCTIM